MSGIAMRDVFTLLGFEEDWQAMTDQQPAYGLSLGNIEVTASEVMGRRFQGPVFLLTGYARTSRTLKEISFECLVEVASVEQGVALIAHAIGEGVKPEVPAPWLELGFKWKDRLPWAAGAGSVRGT